jgi:hypothetical protein
VPGTTDPNHPATRRTIKEIPSQTGLDDFDEAELTSPGYAIGSVGSVGHTAAEVAAAGTGHDTLPPFDSSDANPVPEIAHAVGGIPGIEVQLVHEKGLSQRPGQWRVFEIWTAKSVYAVDGNMLCFGVMDRATGRADEQHRFLGARLMGGESKANGSMSFSYPLPTPGGEAVFQIRSATRGRYGHTSPVEKVVLRVRVTHAVVESTDRLWEEITQTFRLPPGP